MRLSFSSSRTRSASSTPTTRSTNTTTSTTDQGHTNGLLLLPPPPNPPTPSTLAIAYKPALRAVITHIRDKSYARTDSDSLLDIALPLYRTSASTRSQEFSSVSALVTNFYALISQTLAEAGVREYGQIDVRVLLLRYDYHETFKGYLDPPKPQHFDVVTDLQSLVESQRQWTQLFVPDTEQADRMFKQFRAISIAHLGKDVTRAQVLCTNPMIVPGSIIVDRPSTAYGMNNGTMDLGKVYQRVVAVGDFGKLDCATKALLTMAAFLLGDEGMETSPVSTSPIWDENKTWDARLRSSRSRRRPCQLVLKSSMDGCGFLNRRPSTATTRGAEFWYDRVLSFLRAIGNVAPGLVHARADGSHYLEAFSSANARTSFEVVDEVSAPALSRSEKCFVHEGEAAVVMATTASRPTKSRSRSDSGVAGLRQLCRKISRARVGNDGPVQIVFEHA